MVKLLYGTNNKAKLASMEHMLNGTNISLVNGEYDLKNIEIDENGATPAENAKIKAQAFYKAFKVPVFSCDTGLYFKDVEKAQTPGAVVRRINGRYMSDEEMIAHYANVAKLHGGKLIAYYQNAISLVVSEDEIYTYDGEDIHSEEFIISSVPHKNRTHGYPLDSLSVHIESGKFYMDLTTDDKRKYVLEKDIGPGIRNFFLNNLDGVGIDN